MLQAGKDKRSIFRVAFMTGASIFVLGYINALTLNTHDLGTMITAQSGNVIWIGLNAASGYWGYLLENITLLVGFAAGAAFALLNQNRFKNKRVQFYFNWSTFVIPVIIYPLLLQYTIPAFISYFIIGFASGTALGFFRKMYHLEINNAMATGSARFLGLHFVGGFMKKNKEEISSFWIFLLCVLLFSAGAFLYGNLAQLDFSLGESGSGMLIGLADQHEYGYRISLGLSEYRTDVITSNIARFVGLLVISIIPYFFCPYTKDDVSE